MEMAIVLATLSVIALAALPIFLDIHRQAYASMLQSSHSSLGTALTFFRAQVMIDDAEERRQITFVDHQVKMLSGMPEASSNSIRALLDIDLPVSGESQIDEPCRESDFCIIGLQHPNSTDFVDIPNYQFVDHSGLDRVVYIWPQGYTLFDEACYFYYVNQASTDSVIKGHVTRGC